MSTLVRGWQFLKDVWQYYCILTKLEKLAVLNFHWVPYFCSFSVTSSGFFVFFFFIISFFQWSDPWYQKSQISRVQRAANQATDFSTTGIACTQKTARALLSYLIRVVCLVWVCMPFLSLFSEHHL